MNSARYASTLKLLRNCLIAVLAVAATTVPLFLIGRSTLGEGVIAMCYLLPIVWSGSRYGLVPGVVAAVTATLSFDFLFVPPFMTFSVGSLEGWLMLAIFLGVAIFVVERIQASLSKAREAVLMYEFSLALSSQRTPGAIAHATAHEIQQLYQARLVNVVYHPDNASPKIVVSQPGNVVEKEKPDRVLPILTSLGLVGEIQIWRGSYMDLPSRDNPLLKNFAWQAGRNFDRAQPLEAGQ
jgi:K+-sensing histidine kinase KdpD